MNTLLMPLVATLVLSSSTSVQNTMIVFRGFAMNWSTNSSNTCDPVSRSKLDLVFLDKLSHCKFHDTKTPKTARMLCRCV
ncbi:hypothetical protein GGR53DRAFT_495610 [Hypoxylon sp. FL1150]|nr:hypothetical protein GGR53DRAFT_495610 [Hypoxylon sp. FL1150]